MSLVNAKKDVRIKQLTDATTKVLQKFYYAELNKLKYLTHISSLTFQLYRGKVLAAVLVCRAGMARTRAVFKAVRLNCSLNMQQVSFVKLPLFIHHVIEQNEVREF